MGERDEAKGMDPECGTVADPKERMEQLVYSYFVNRWGFYPERTTQHARPVIRYSR